MNTANTKPKFCAYCFAYHQEEVMIPVVTRGGTKWRCKVSLQASKLSAAQRDAFGKKVTQENSQRLSSQKRTLNAATNRARNKVSV